MQAPNIVRNHSRQKAAVGLHVTVMRHAKTTDRVVNNWTKNIKINTNGSIRIDSYILHSSCSK